MLRARHGKPWTKAEMVRVKKAVESGVPLKSISKTMHRPEGGAATKLRSIYEAEMFQFASDEDTLITWRKKKKEKAELLKKFPGGGDAA